MTNETVQQRPKAGQTILVRHRTKQNKAGVADIETTSNKMSASQRIKAVYMDGRVLTTSGDVWSVKPSKGKEDWESVDTFSAA